MKKLWIISAFITASLLALSGCSLKPIDAQNNVRRAKIAFNNGDYASAENYLTRVIEYDFSYSDGHYWMGRCYEIKADLKEAVYEYSLAVKFNPASADAQQAYILGLNKLGRKAEAAEAAALFIKHRRPEETDYLNIGQSFLDANMEEPGVLVLEEGALKNPQDASCLVALADYFFSKNNDQKGKDSLVRAFKADPLFPGLARRLGVLGMKVDIPEPTLFSKPPAHERKVENTEK